MFALVWLVERAWRLEKAPASKALEGRQCGPRGLIWVGVLPIPHIVLSGQSLGHALSLAAERNRRRDPKHPERVLWPRSFAVLAWFLILLCVGVSAIGWLAFDDSADAGDLSTRWLFLPAGIAGIAMLVVYYNSYVETHEDRLVYRTWRRRVHRVPYEDITAYRFASGKDAAGLRIWTKSGKAKFFQTRLFDLAPTIKYLQEHDVEDRTKPKRWWR